MSVGTSVGQLHFRVVVTKSVETSAPPGGEGGPSRRGGAHLGHVFRGQTLGWFPAHAHAGDSARVLDVACECACAPLMPIQYSVSSTAPSTDCSTVLQQSSAGALYPSLCVVLGSHPRTTLRTTMRSHVSARPRAHPASVPSRRQTRVRSLHRLQPQRLPEQALTACSLHLIR